MQADTEWGDDAGHVSVEESDDAGNDATKCSLNSDKDEKRDQDAETTLEGITRADVSHKRHRKGYRLLPIVTVAVNASALLLATPRRWAE